METQTHLKKIDLINKIEAQYGYVDYLDCFKIVDIYTELYGITYNYDLKLEYELMIMYDKIKRYDYES